VLGHLWAWVSDVFGRIGDVAFYWLILALILKAAESALIGLTWRNILRAAYPRSRLSFRTAWGASQGGTAINALAPAQAGTAAMIGIFRTSIRGSSVASVTTATVVESLFFTVASVLLVIGVAIFRPRTVSKGSPADESGGFVASHPIIVGLVIVAVIGIVVLIWPRLKPRLLSTWHKVKEGASIFRDKRRYAREVAAPSAGSYCCRIGVNVVFMAAFGIPITVYTVLLVASSHTLSQLFAITPGGVGQTQALDVVTLRRYAPPSDATAFSVTQDSVITIWNVVLGIAVLLWAFGFTQAKQMLSKKGREEAAGGQSDRAAPARSSAGSGASRRSHFNFGSRSGGLSGSAGQTTARRPGDGHSNSNGLR
jgi:Lysylphosphatidylglycerol synthase TM region